MGYVSHIPKDATFSSESDAPAACVNVTLQTAAGLPVSVQLISVPLPDSERQPGHLLGVRELGQHDAGHPDLVHPPGRATLSSDLVLLNASDGPLQFGPSGRQVDVDTMSSRGSSESLWSATGMYAKRWDYGGVKSVRVTYDTSEEGMPLQAMTGVRRQARAPHVVFA